MTTARKFVCTALVAAGVFGVVGACATRDDKAAASEASIAAACSTGPMYRWDSTFVTEDAPAGYVVGEKDPPTCTNHCATDTYPPGYNSYPYEALPSGSCASDAALCSMRAKPACPCVGDVGFPQREGGFSTFYCRCEAGAWRCARIRGGKIDAVGCHVMPSSPKCIPNPGYPYTIRDASTGG